METGNVILAVFAILSALFRGYIKPRIDELGFFRKAVNLNNDRCYRVEALEACEDLYVNREFGLAYFACSNRLQRAYWEPPLGLLRRDKLPFPSQDYIAILDLNTLEHHKLDLVNLPPHLIKNGLHTHGIDLYVHPSDGFEDDHGQIRLSGDSSDGSGSVRKATIYAINHNPPDDLNSTSSVGAQSVVEVFDTVLGDTQATHRRTIESEFILTPNNIVGMSESSFYVTNDHQKKVHWLDSIAYCSFAAEVDCKVAWHGKRPFPNGLAKGPDNYLYMATTVNSWLQVFEIQPNHTLFLKEELKLPRMTDNIHVTPSGSIFLTNIPTITKFIKKVKNYPTDSSLGSPVEIWKVSNVTGENALIGGKMQVEKIFGDDSNEVSGSTGVAIWNSKLILTGLASSYVSICELDSELLN
ncbi:hypothetical protein PPACK8108_LOCUS23781 [Phakopsora pachyrhizi]|uniref:Serum paraoxonase/arylesterase n=1 Tax=Phakopsora pachyrhizi TaxID=170000 RepID=A0AAV0BPZ0_PHAPC|nr:hypothetical protein PPACK8108_LOCUS23781 [Phakopsora pachyrhizi]